VKPPVTLNSFDKQFRAVEASLRASLDAVRAQLHHGGNKGTSAENAFREALGRFLPRRLQLGHGEVIDTHGNRSSQCDLVIATDQHPNWFNPDHPNLFLIEAVAGAAEIKSVLTTDHLNTAIESAKRFRALRPNWSGLTEAAGSESDVRRFYRSPPFFLFAYESQLSVETVCERLEAATDTRIGRTGESIDGVFILDTGFVLNFGDGEGSFVTKPADGSGQPLRGYYWDNERAPLLMLMSWLPLSLTVPLYQVPVLSHYLLGDESKGAVLETSSES
jgi:hypothetical protein